MKKSNPHLQLAVGNHMFSVEQTQMINEVITAMEKRTKEDTIKLIKERYDYWDNSRGGYILDQKHRDELEEFLFTGKSKTLGDYKKDATKRN